MSEQKAIAESAMEYLCPVCPETFRFAEDLSRHASDFHSQPRDIEVKITCEICLDEFQTLHELKIHVEDHAAQKNDATAKQQATKDQMSKVELKNILLDIRNLVKNANTTLGSSDLDNFGQKIASELLKLNLETRIQAQDAIQEVLLQFRLDNLKKT